MINPGEEIATLIFVHRPETMIHDLRKRLSVIARDIAASIGATHMPLEPAIDVAARRHEQAPEILRSTTKSMLAKNRAATTISVHSQTVRVACCHEQSVGGVRIRAEMRTIDGDAGTRHRRCLRITTRPARWTPQNDQTTRFGAGLRDQVDDSARPLRPSDTNGHGVINTSRFNVLRQSVHTRGVVEHDNIGHVQNVVELARIGHEYDGEVFVFADYR